MPSFHLLNRFENQGLGTGAVAGLCQGSHHSHGIPAPCSYPIPALQEAARAHPSSSACSQSSPCLSQPQGHAPQPQPIMAHRAAASPPLRGTSHSHTRCQCCHSTSKLQHPWLKASWTLPAWASWQAPASPSPGGLHLLQNMVTLPAEAHLILPTGEEPVYISPKPSSRACSFSRKPQSTGCRRTGLTWSLQKNGPGWALHTWHMESSRYGSI